ncbi:MAG: tripartite tricarboxylate transporter substrate binding protein [Betaproteobacteria bacterium]|nr:tripartite tricarboxylate transporter substrate binding protein [Betaproteobacteria bacterium]
MFRLLSSLLFQGLIALGIVAPDALAQDYPDKPIRIIISFAAGGSADIFARAFAQRAALGQPIVVENVPGASGAIGLVRAANSPPDGYTLTTGATSTFAVSPHINSKLPYDPLRDFVPIALLGQIVAALTVNSSVPAKSVGELVALAKANPGKYNYASLGVGSAHHMLGELLARAAGINIVHVPYKGSPQAQTALLAGEIQMFFFPAFVDAVGHLQSGRLRALGVVDTRRSPAAPEVPTLTELGYDIVAPTWHILVAPTGTPNAIVRRLAAEVQRVNALDDMKRILAQQGADASPFTPDALKAYLASEHARYARIIREVGIKAE